MNTIIFFGLLILVITLEACVDVFNYKSWTEKKQPWGWMYHLGQIVYALTLYLFGYWTYSSINEPSIVSWLIILFAAASCHFAAFDPMYNFIMHKDIPVGSTSLWDILMTKIGIGQGSLLISIIKLILVFISAIFIAGVMKDVIYL